MKLDVNCEKYKTARDGVIHRCACHFLNRKVQKEYKLYRKFMNNLEKK